MKKAISLLLALSGFSTSVKAQYGNATYGSPEYKQREINWEINYNLKEQNIKLDQIASQQQLDASNQRIRDMQEKSRIRFQEFCERTEQKINDAKERNSERLVKEPKLYKIYPPATPSHSPDIFDRIESQTPQASNSRDDTFNPDKPINAICIKDCESCGLSIKQGTPLHVAEKNGFLMSQKINFTGGIDKSNYSLPIPADCVKPVN
jgi:TolA-binding protein